SRSGRSRRTPRALARALSSCPDVASTRVDTIRARVRALESHPRRVQRARTDAPTARAWSPMLRALSRDHRSFASNRVTDAGVPEATYACPSAVYPPAFPKETTPLILRTFLTRREGPWGRRSRRKTLRQTTKKRPRAT